MHNTQRGYCQKRASYQMLLLWFVIVRQLIGKIFPAPVTLVYPAPLIKKETIGFDYDPV
jgi:hypothetical protein